MWVVTDILSNVQGAILFHLYVIVCLPKAPRKTFGKVKYEAQTSEEENKHGTLPPMKTTSRITTVLNCTHCWANACQSLTLFTQNYFGVGFGVFFQLFCIPKLEQDTWKPTPTKSCYQMPHQDFILCCNKGNNFWYTLIYTAASAQKMRYSYEILQENIYLIISPLLGNVLCWIAVECI